MTLPSPVPEEDLHAYIDGALSPARAKEVHEFLCENPAVADRVEAYRRDAQAIARIFSRLDAPIEGEGDDVATPPAPRWLAQPWLRAAAAITLFLAGLLAGWMGFGPTSGSDELARFAAAAATGHQLVLASVPPRPLDTQRDALSRSMTAALGTEMQLRPPEAGGPEVVGAYLLPVADGQAVQLTLRDGADVYTLTMQARPGAEETAFRRVASGAVTTVVWTDDDHGLICAVTGTAPADRLERVARRIYTNLLI